MQVTDTCHKLSPRQERNKPQNHVGQNTALNMSGSQMVFKNDLNAAEGLR